MKRSSRNVIRVVALAAAAAVTSGSLGAVQFIAASSASAMTGLVKVSTVGPSDSTSTKTLKAYCPTGTRVVGGAGGPYWSSVDQPKQVVLTQLQPVHPLSGDDFFSVTGNETQVGTTSNWSLQATAVCAPPLAGMHIIFANTVLSSSSSQMAQAVCPDGEKVLGNGGWVYPTGGQVGLQVTRASTDGALAYAGAHEDATGYIGTWNVMAFAVCAPEPAGYQVLTIASDDSASQELKYAEAVCPAGKGLLGAGAATEFAAPGNVSINRTLISNNRVYATGIENTATSLNWDFIVAQAICAT